MGNVFDSDGKSMFTFGKATTYSDGKSSHMSGFGNTQMLYSNGRTSYKFGNTYNIGSTSFYKNGNMVTGNGKTYIQNGSMVTSSDGKSWYNVESEDDLFRILEDDN